MGAFRISAEPPGYRQAPTTANAGKDKKRRTQNEAEENFNAGSVGSDGDRVADVCQLWTDRYGQQWDVSKSKTATQLDKDFISDVTLSLPAAEEQLVSDVVLVLDKSTSAALEEQALAMLRELKGRSRRQMPR